MKKEFLIVGSVFVAAVLVVGGVYVFAEFSEGEQEVVDVREEEDVHEELSLSEDIEEDFKEERIDEEFFDEAGENDPMRELFERQRAYTDTEISGDVTFSTKTLYEDPVSGANIWLFAVPDDTGRVIMSTEKGQVIYMAELDLENPGATPDWKQMVSKSEIGNQGIADHWHVFDHGFHYLVFSQTQANSAYMMKVDTDLNRVDLEHIVDNYPLDENDGALYANSEGGARLITNDMFLVAEPAGVTAGFFLPGIGHKLFRADTNLDVYDVMNIGGGVLSHGNGSSVIPVDGGFHLLASDSITEVTQSGVRLLAFDKDWNFVSEDMLVNFDRQSIGMVSGVYLDDGSLVMHARTSLDAPARGAQPSFEDKGNSDAGALIARYVFDPDLNLASIDFISDESKQAYRPHTSLLGNALIVGWDYVGTTVLRIDEIE